MNREALMGKQLTRAYQQWSWVLILLNAWLFSSLSILGNASFIQGLEIADFPLIKNALLCSLRLKTLRIIKNYFALNSSTYQDGVTAAGPRA